jgi:hypothetical protein
MSTCSITSRADETSDGGSHTIGSDHKFRRHLTLSRVAIREAYAADATVAGADEVDELRFERDLGTGPSRGIDKQPVNDGTPGRVETVNAVLRFDLHFDDLVVIVKRRRSDQRRACRFDSVENAPARKLNNTGSHEGVSRDRIAPVVTAVDREHSKASSCEEHRGGRTGATSSDDNDVVVRGWGGTGCQFVSM